MRKSSAIFVSAIALGLAMFVPLKASAQGVSIYIGPGYPADGGYPAMVVTQPTMLVTQPTMLVTQPTMLVTQPTQAPTTHLIPATMVRTVMAVLTTALIGAKVDALRAEFIGDMNAGSKPGVSSRNGSGRNLHRVLDALGMLASRC